MHRPSTYEEAKAYLKSLDPARTFPVPSGITASVVKAVTVKAAQTAFDQNSSGSFIGVDSSGLSLDMPDSSDAASPVVTLPGRSGDAVKKPGSTATPFFIIGAAAIGTYFLVKTVRKKKTFKRKSVL